MSFFFLRKRAWCWRALSRSGGSRAAMRRCCAGFWHVVRALVRRTYHQVVHFRRSGCCLMSSSNVDSRQATPEFFAALLLYRTMALRHTGAKTSASCTQRTFQHSGACVLPERPRRRQRPRRVAIRICCAYRCTSCHQHSRGLRAGLSLRRHVRWLPWCVHYDVFRNLLSHAQAAMLQRRSAAFKPCLALTTTHHR